MYDDSVRTRRRFLAGAATATAIGVAGCGSDGSDTEDDPDDDTEPTGNETGPAATTTAGESDPTTTAAAPASDGVLDPPVAGDPEADVTVMVFEDYACPHCADYSLNVFPEIRSQYVDTEEIRYEFRDFPIPVSPESSRAANAARAVQDTVGDAAYYTYSKQLFENQSNLGLDTYESEANDVDGADPAAIRAAGAEESYTETVQADRQRGVEMGVGGTPEVFVDGSIVEGGATVENITDAIEDAL